MDFEPIAIVGRGCAFPGAFTPDALWDGLLQQKDFLSSPTQADWGLSYRTMEKWVESDPWSTRGGYIRGFEQVFDPSLYRLPTDEVAQSDPLLQWTLYASRNALLEAGLDPRVDSHRAGVILGNLSLPSRGLSTFAESVWANLMEQELQLTGFYQRVMKKSPRAVERFMSGRPAHVVAQAFGLHAGSMALDAACASSLYAIRLACDWLHQGRADVMLAGAVNGADPLFLHTGFRVLRASSRTGQSRPFHQQADGLVPSEGAGMVVLKRLTDAVSAGDNILAVIRGVGLSNDGGSKGVLVPSKTGQVDAMRRAYEMSGVRPRDISYVECHATGTALGDLTELRSMAEVFDGADGIHIGSSKSNLGHLVTASGVASLMKVLSGLEKHILPPNIHVDDPLAEAISGPFQLLTRETPWVSDTPRFAGVNSFGFGGNNGHLIVEEWVGQKYDFVSPGFSSPDASAPDELAVVGIGVVAGTARGKAELLAALDHASGQGMKNQRQPFATEMDNVELHPTGLRYPPKDLQETLPQQLSLLEAAREAMAEVKFQSDERVGVLAGMECDAEIVRHIVSIRGEDWVEQWNHAAGPETRTLKGESMSPLFARELTAAGVIGLLPNMVANRLNHFFRLTGPGFSVSSEELSGLDAFVTATELLRSGEIDAALVGAVDVSCEPVHQAAIRQVLGKDVPGDVAVVLVVKRLEDAKQAGDTVYATLADSTHESSDTLLFGDETDAVNLTPVFGHAHTASGLLHAAVAALSCYHGVRPRTDGRGIRPWLSPVERQVACVSMQSFHGRRMRLHLQAESGKTPVPLVLEAVPRLFIYSAPTRKILVDRLYGQQNEEANQESVVSGEYRQSVEDPQSVEDKGEGGERYRLVVMATTEDERAERCRLAIGSLEEIGTSRGVTRLLEGVYYSEVEEMGELALVFTGAAASYGDMGKPLLLAYPELRLPLQGDGETASLLQSFVDKNGGTATPFTKLVGTSFLSRFHAQLSTKIFGLEPQATIGLSAGETNALMAMGAWKDSNLLFADFRQSDLFDGVLGSPFRVLQSTWPSDEVDWTSWRILAPVGRVSALVQEEPYVRLTIIHTNQDCVIAGHPDACRRVIEQVGGHRAIAMEYDFVIHCKEVDLVREEWRTLHSRPTRAIPGVRFYSSSTYSFYEPDRERSAEALVGMAVEPVDFPRLIEAAWNDGVRVFIEHGPRSLCGGWIRQILGHRDGFVLSLDDATDMSIHHFVDVIAQLVAYGYDIDANAILDRLRRSSYVREDSEEPVYRFRSHPLSPDFSQALSTATVTLLPEAPRIPVCVTTQPQGEHRTNRAFVKADPLAHLAMAHHSHMAQMYRQFVMQQATIHQQFMGRVVGAEEELLVAMSSVLDSAVSQSFTRLEEPAVDAPTLSTLGSGEPQLSATYTPTLFPTGPSFSRSQLEVLASGKISSVFGPLFAKQDEYVRQVRMPEPPLLLVDRVLGIEGEPGSMGTGTIWTATDIVEDAWYLHDGYVPFGILVEAGQADLLLISWLGADFLNRDERVYRLLGCEMTFHGRLPVPGDTVEYEIHIDGHAKHGDVRLFFFHYDCYVNGVKSLTMRNGQAGFFSDEELRQSRGVIWTPDDVTVRSDVRVDEAMVHCQLHRFSADQVARFAEGDVYGCFGPGFELSATHVRTPRIQSGMMQLIHHVTEFDTHGGPWGRGYLRAETPLTGDEWYFPCHFKGDPAMPGTLMMEGCFQAIAFYMTGLGFTLDNDGYRFEIVPDEAYKAVCRGQATPESRMLVYEIFVEEVTGGSIPQVTADVLVTVDGLKAFHCRRMAVRLIPDWPLTSARHLLRNHQEPCPVAKVGDFEFDYASLLACAWGRPSDAFGPIYKPFDGARRLPRLPGPPYHFMSRIVRIDGEQGVARAGTMVEVEYDIPTDAWYFSASKAAVMPYCVLLEAALQPCGWLTAFVGIPLQCDTDLSFRNLDGTGTMHGEVHPDAGVLTTRAQLVNVSRMGNTFIETFKVECYQGHRLIYSLNTVFGHFPHAELSQQAGLPATDLERVPWDEASPYWVDLRPQPSQFFAGKLRLPEPPLLMLDRITGYWPNTANGQKACFRAEKLVNTEDWFFKAHFFQDPVQPGSLGLEAMIQLLQAAMIELGLGEGLSNPRFESIVMGEPLTWKYRGQVLPSHQQIVILVELLDSGTDHRGVYAIANASLIADGTKIYHAERLGMRIVDDGASGEMTGQ